MVFGAYPGQKKKANPAKVPSTGAIVRQTLSGDGQGNLSESRITPAGTLLTRAELSPELQAVSRISQRSLGQLARELSQSGGTFTDQQTARRLADSTYASLAKTINGESTAQRDVVRSELSRRFGGTTASTFGNELLSRVEGTRLDSLVQARSEADAAGQDQLRQLENSRIQRVSAFSKLIEGNSSIASQLGKQSSSLLQNERTRRQSKSLAVASLRQKYQTDREKIAQQRERAWLQFVGNTTKAAAMAAA